jgi:transcriptional regulator with PAS, ATPase and Fis domain
LEKVHLGTCFFDEVADLSPALQGKRLRVIQEREICRVGSTVPMAIDVRIVAASTKTFVCIGLGRHIQRTSSIE